MRFQGRTVVITGASSGIGRALAMELARHGAKIGVIARRRDKLEELTRDLSRIGATASWATADVAEREETRKAMAELRRQLGPLDCLIANAGVGAPTLLNPLNIEQVMRMFHVNLFGVVYAIEAVLPEMLARRRRDIAAVSSLAAYKGVPGESAYCASKAAVNTYLEGLRIQLRGHGIAVTTICPGFVKTPMTEPFEFHMPFLLDAESAARRIVRALARRRKVYDFPWPMALFMRLARWAPDWVMARGARGYVDNPPKASAM